MRKLALTVLCLAASGCGPTLLLPSPYETAPSRSYTLGQAQTVATGETVAKVQRLYAIPAYTPAAPYQVQDTGASEAFMLSPGQKWAVWRVTGDGDLYLTPPEDTPVRDGLILHLNEDGTIGKGWVARNRRTSRDGLPEHVRFDRVPGTLLEGSFQAELVYSGRSGDTIRLLYREYTDNLARPAFTQDLTYDLGESSEIRFRSIAIDVAEANSSGITYTVVDDGGLDWLP